MRFVKLTAILKNRAVFIESLCCCEFESVFAGILWLQAGLKYIFKSSKIIFNQP